MRDPPDVGPSGVSSGLFPRRRLPDEWYAAQRPLTAMESSAVFDAVRFGSVSDGFAVGMHTLRGCVSPCQCCSLLGSDERRGPIASNQKNYLIDQPQ